MALYADLRWEEKSCLVMSVNVYDARLWQARTASRINRLNYKYGFGFMVFDVFRVEPLLRA